MKKGQAGIEFLQTFMLLGLLFIVFSLFIANEFSFFMGEPVEQSRARRFAENLASEIDTAYIAGDGYKSSITLPELIAGKDFNVYYNKSERVIEIDIIDLNPEEDLYAIAHFMATDVVMYGVDNGTIHIANSAGKISLWGEDGAS